MIADDADDIRMLLRMQLSADARFSVVGEAADGQEALDLIDANQPDLLVLDLAMPRMDGLEVLERLHNRDRPPIVVLSGFTNEAMIERALELGAAAYITKGHDLETLPDQLATAVEEHRATHPTHPTT